MLRGPQKGIFELDFQVPSGCAEQLASGAADIGIVPSFELIRQDLEVIQGVGIACHGAVRSILLVSSRPAAEIRALAVDSSSRTSVQLARIILKQRYGAEPVMTAHAPDLDAMLRVADAALIIGDPALRIEPKCLPYHVYDLGAEWVEMTGLPMVFAVWAGRSHHDREPFAASLRFGMEHIEDIVAAEYRARGISRELAREYLTHNVTFDLGPAERKGLDLFLEYAKEHARSPVLL